MSEVLAVVLLSFLGGVLITLSVIIWLSQHPRKESKS